MKPRTRRKARLPVPDWGFTLIEMVMAMTVMGVLAASFMVFFKPVVDGYFDARRRADLSDMADTALRLMMQDIRRAVPNSLHVVDGTTTDGNAACFHLVPTVGGGRYRTGPDIANDAAPCVSPTACSAFPDSGGARTSASSIDVLAMQGALPAAGDHLAIDNASRTDIYGPGAPSRYRVMATPSTPRATDGTHRIALDGNPAAGGYVDGRFQVIAQAEPSILYVCAQDRLYRRVLDANLAVACALDGAVLATDVAACEFNYRPGVTQASGFIELHLRIERAGEAVALAYGVHVDNLP